MCFSNTLEVSQMFCHRKVYLWDCIGLMRVFVIEILYIWYCNLWSCASKRCVYETLLILIALVHICCNIVPMLMASAFLCDHL